ncbi:MAG: L-threonylcarbamoyladenylate synthase [Planctomycetota bacterium]
MVVGVDEAAGLLRSGGVVAFPTETVYGLGAVARDEPAVRRVFEIKGRPPSNPLIVHATGESMARGCCDAWPTAVSMLAGAFWPGPLTLVLPKAGWVSDAVTAGGATVAVRVPDQPVALDLIERVGLPLVGPSANPSGRLSPTRAEHVAEAFGERVAVVDGGPCRVGIESTVLDLASGPPRILRPGVLGADAIARVLGTPVESHAAAGEPGVGSPGLVGPHYRPRTPLVLAGTLGQLDARLRGAASAVVLSPPGASLAVDPPHASIAMPGDAAAYARELYAALREADAMSPTLIVACWPGGDSATWRAIEERLERAAEGTR